MLVGVNVDVGVGVNVDVGVGDAVAVGRNGVSRLSVFSSVGTSGILVYTNIRGGGAFHLAEAAVNLGRWQRR